MRRQRRAERPATSERLNLRITGRGLDPDPTLDGVGFQFLELQFQLIEHLAAALGGLAILLAPQLGDHQLQMRDHRCGARSADFRDGQFLALLQY